MPLRHFALRSMVGVAVTGLAVALAPAGPAAADQLPLSATDQAVHDKLAHRATRAALGRDLAGLVTDVTTGTRLWSHSRGEGQIPASNTKIITAVTALETFGPDHRFTTEVTTGATRHQVVLVGSGDPSLSSRQLGRMARTVVASAQAKGLAYLRVLVDDSLFPAPSLAYGWRSSYQISSISPVRSLVVDQHRRWDTSLDAGRVFARKLERRGIDVRSVHRRVRPAGATVIAESTGTDLATQVATMLQESDNDIAEGLHRLVALQTGFPTTWDGARQAQSTALAKLGVTLSRQVYDGSGLSRRNRLSPTDVVNVLATIFDEGHPNLAGLQDGAFAVAGVSGTLGPRFLRYVTAPTSCAVGLVQAKTGSLSGVISLSGFARGADGQVKLFSFLLNHVPDTLRTRRAVDKLASTITGCW